MVFQVDHPPMCLDEVRIFPGGGPELLRDVLVELLIPPRDLYFLIKACPVPSPSRRRFFYPADPPAG